MIVLAVLPVIFCSSWFMGRQAIETRQVRTRQSAHLRTDVSDETFGWALAPGHPLRPHGPLITRERGRKVGVTDRRQSTARTLLLLLEHVPDHDSFEHDRCHSHRERPGPQQIFKNMADVIGGDDRVPAAAFSTERKAQPRT